MEESAPRKDNIGTDPRDSEVVRQVRLPDSKPKDETYQNVGPHDGGAEGGHTDHVTRKPPAEKW